MPVRSDISTKTPEGHRMFWGLCDLSWVSVDMYFLKGTDSLLTCSWIMNTYFITSISPLLRLLNVISRTMRSSTSRWKLFSSHGVDSMELLGYVVSWATSFGEGYSFFSRIFLLCSSVLACLVTSCDQLMLINSIRSLEAFAQAPFFSCVVSFICTSLRTSYFSFMALLGDFRNSMSWDGLAHFNAASTILSKLVGTSASQSVWSPFGLMYFKSRAARRICWLA